MTRRTARSRPARPGRRITPAVVAGGVSTALLAIVALVSLGPPAGAEDQISVHPDDVVIAPPGSVTVVATEEVPADLIGKTCALRVVADNGSSVHPGNALIVHTGDARTVVSGVEDSPDGQVVGTEQVVLGPTLVFELEMGPDGTSSLGFSVGVDCIPPPAPAAPLAPAAPATPEPTVLPAQQLPVAPPAAPTVAAPTYTG